MSGWLRKGSLDGRRGRGCGWDGQALKFGQLRRGYSGPSVSRPVYRIIDAGSRTLESKLWRGVAASLVVADQAQNLAEACRRQQAAVLCVCDLPYFAQHGRLQLRPLEELDGDFACDDAELLRVGLLEQVLEGALLVGREVQAALCERRWLALRSSQQQHGLQGGERRTEGAVRREVRHIHCGRRWMANMQ